jgi:hypothetical protein
MVDFSPGIAGLEPELTAPTEDGHDRGRRTVSTWRPLQLVPDLNFARDPSLYPIFTPIGNHNGQ